MSWVRRGQDGKIEGAAEEHLAGFDEELPTNDPELRAFMDNTAFQPQTGRDGASALLERRARRAERDGSVEGRLKAINLRMGA